MIRGVVVVVLLASCLGGCATYSTVELEQSQQRYEALLWLQAEQIQQQRNSILALQKQREQMQRQIVQLAHSVSNNTPVLIATSGTTLESAATKPVKVKKRVQVDASGKLILGQVEWAWFDLFNDSVKARLDTGAKSSVLYASEIQMFERDGDDWVRFSVSASWVEGATAQVKVYEAPLIRKVKVRQAAGDPFTRRPVVKLTTKVGSIVEDIEFVLQNKNSGEFPVVLGRSFIRDIAVVDVAQKFTQVKHIKAVTL